MGTTESVFSDEPAVVDQPSPRPVDEASSQKKSAQQQQQEQIRQTPPPPLTRGASEVSAVRRRSFSAAAAATTTTISTTNTTQRCSPHSIFRLQGLVLGMEHSGKRTLLQRFEGKDPFDSSSSSSTLTRKTEILVPYKAPSPPPPPAAASLQQQSNQNVASATTTTTTSTGAVVWDDRIQLHVRAMTDPPTEAIANAASSQDNQGISSSGVDFAILLLDPRQKQQQQQQHHASSHSHGHGKEKHPKRHRKRVKHHLEATIRSLLHLQGYTRQQDEHQQEEGVSASSSTSSSPVIRRPLCLCLLLNFRDLMGDDDDDNRDIDEHVLQESDVTSLTMQVLQDYAHQLDSQQMVLQCITVSLQNCYGLALLHYFIYQSYLQRKRYDAQLLLQTIQSLQHEAQLHVQSLLVSYPDFVAQTTITSEQRAARKMQQQLQPVEQQQQRPQHSETKTTKEEEKNAVDSVGEDDRDNSNVEVQQQQLQQPNGRRRVMTAPTAPPPPQAKQQPTQPKDALEAFLGSSSDEEDIDKSAGKLQGKSVIGNRRTISADTSDDDDDFFMDKVPEEEENNAEMTSMRRDGKETKLSAQQPQQQPQQQQQQQERRTAFTPRERIKDDSHIMAGRSTERPQPTPPRPVQQEQDVAEKEQPASVDKGSSKPAPLLRSQEEKNNSTGNVVGTSSSTAESTTSLATSSSVAGDSTSGREDEDKADALKRSLPVNDDQFKPAAIKRQENNCIKNAHSAAATPASPQKRQEPTESTGALPPSSISTEVSPTSQSVAPKGEMAQEDHQKQSLPNSNETTASLSEDEHEDDNLHTSRSATEEKCDGGVALNKNGKGDLDSSERETSQDALDLRVGGSLVAGCSVTAATQTGMVADEDISRNKPGHLGTNQHDDSDDDDDGQFVIGASAKRNNHDDDDDDDDDEFFIGSSGSTYSSAAQTPPAIAHQKASPPDGIGNSSTTAGSGGLSPEAREAIAKAQQAFERELYSSVVPNQPGPAAHAAGTMPSEQDSVVAASAASTSTSERSKKHKKEKKKKKEDSKKEKKKAEKKERKKSKHSGDV